MRTVGIALACVVTALVGCARDCKPRSGAAPPNVVLLTVDTLRADHLGCYGNTQVRTPNFDRLAAESVLFERCYSPSHITLPSHLSLLSSLPLADHGLTSNLAREARRVTVLPHLFAQAGYRTAAFVSAKLLGPKGQIGPLLAGDVEAYDAPRKGATPYRAEETNRRFLRWLRGACRDPVFAWIHYWDPHLPYEPPAPFDTAYYTGDPRDARHSSMSRATLSLFFHDLTDLRERLQGQAAAVRALKRDLGLSNRGVRKLVLWRENLERYPVPVDELRRRLDALTGAIRPGLPYRPYLTDWLTGIRDLEFPRAAYAGEVSYVDQQLGGLRAALGELGLAERTILVVTADHGESLGEHGVYFDHFSLHEPNIHVPLLVSAPGRVAADRRLEPVSGLDVAPTILRLAGLPVPAAMQGQDLFARDGRRDAVVAEAGRGRQLMVAHGRWKLIRTLRSFYYVESFARAAGTVELYDRDADPAERENVIARHADTAADLAARLDAWMTSHQVTLDGASAPALPAEKQRELRSLGYVE